jgi:predicted SAM-dependent methyltransferase
MIPPVLEKSTEPLDAKVNGNFSSAGGIRLNLGGRGTKIEGFKTVDLSPEHDADIQSDVSDLSMFEDGTVDEIYASQILEHFPHVQTEKVLKEWHRVLKKGSRITIGVPDFARVVEIYAKTGLCSWIISFIHGDQKYPLAYHYVSFTFATLAQQLNQVGFKNIRRIHSMPYGIVDCSSNVSNVDGKNVNLLVEAWK